MLAMQPAEDVDAILADPLPKRTPATIADLATLHRELALIRSRHGLAYDDQELAVGLSSVAALHPNGRRRVGRSLLTGPMPARWLNRMAPFLTRAARGISEHIGRAIPATRNDTDSTTVTDDMMSRVLRTLSSDDWV